MTGPLLQMVDVHMHFGGVHSLRGVSVDVEAGRLVGLIGPNGAGKTTLFNVATGLLRPSSGQVRFRGMDITAQPAYRRSRLGLGRSFQNLGLVPSESIRANVMANQFTAAGYGLGSVIGLPWRHRLAEERMWAAATTALREFDVTDDPDTLVGDLSFGVARRVELAGLIARDPQLLLLDEPTTGLDTEEIETLKARLHVQRDRGKTMLVVAHDLGFVLDMCDDVYVLAEGAIIFHGPAEQARTNASVVESFLGSVA